MYTWLFLWLFSPNSQNNRCLLTPFFLKMFVTTYILSHFLLSKTLNEYHMLLHNIHAVYSYINYSQQWNWINSYPLLWTPYIYITRCFQTSALPLLFTLWHFDVGHLTTSNFENRPQIFWMTWVFGFFIIPIDLRQQFLLCSSLHSNCVYNWCPCPLALLIITMFLPRFGGRGIFTTGKYRRFSCCNKGKIFTAILINVACS